MPLKNIISKLVFLLALIPITPQGVNAQKVKKNKKPAIVFTKEMIEKKGFVFIPTIMMPMRGSSRSITSDYQLSVTKDSLISYLPYIGRATTAPILPGENGYDFTSTSFDYMVKDNKKSGWDITIKPKDKMNVQQFALHVFDNGSASLNISSMNRDPISYSGYITEVRRKE